MTETNELPKQAFQIGQRVWIGTKGRSWLIGSIYVNAHNGRVLFAEDVGQFGIDAVALTLVPERPPYVPSERLILDRETGRPAAHSNLSVLYRCETDPELAMRRVAEWAEYDAQEKGE